MPLPLRSVSDAWRLIRNRQIWKELNYVYAAASYLLSLALALGAFALVVKGLVVPGFFTILLALYFLQQAVYILIVSAIVERRRFREPINFPERRKAA